MIMVQDLLEWLHLLLSATETNYEKINSKFEKKSLGNWKKNVAYYQFQSKVSKHIVFA